MVKKKVEQQIRVFVERYNISAKFNEYVFCPANAIEERFYNRSEAVLPEFVTTDGVICSAEFIGTWNNRGNVYEDEFDRICQRRYGIPFVSIRSMWIGRLGTLDYFWHLIRLEVK